MLRTQPYITVKGLYLGVFFNSTINTGGVMIETAQVGKKVYLIRWRHPNKIARQDRRQVKPEGRYHFSRSFLKEGSEAWKNLFGHRTRLQVGYVLLRLVKMKRSQTVFLRNSQYQALNEHREVKGRERLVRYMCLPQRRGGKKNAKNSLLLTPTHRSFLQGMLQGGTIEELAHHLIFLETPAAARAS